MNQSNVSRFIKLSSKNFISLDDARTWFKTVLASAPPGVPTSSSSIGLNGQPVMVRMIRRSVGSGTELIVPMTRDLSSDEVAIISHEWKKAGVSGEFEISASQSQPDKLNNTVATLNIPRDEYQGLCLELAKRQHESWMRDKVDAGWRYGTTISITEKTHPMLRPWDDLPEQYKDVNTDSPEQFLNFLNNQGFAVVRKEELGALLKLLRNVR